jgi:hypothetical protein
MQVHKCKAPKTRNYQCDEDGYKVIKLFSYLYDIESDSCVEHVKKETKKCNEQHLTSRRDFEGRYTDEFDDFEEVILPKNKKADASQKFDKNVEPVREREVEDLYILRKDDVKAIADQSSN